MTQRSVIDLSLDQSAQLRTAYETYQMLLSCIQNKDFNQFHVFIATYQRQLNPMDTVITTFKRNQQAIFNSLTLPYSNGPIEGMNRKIKALKNHCYGFRNLSHFFVRIQLLCE